MLKKTERGLSSVLYCSALLCMVLLLCAGACDTSAAELHVSVKNQKFSFDVDPGEERVMELPVMNTHDVATTIVVDALDYRVEDENAVVIEQVDDVERSLRQWITAEPQQITLDPHGTAIVRVTMRVPLHAALGSHHGLIVVRTVSNVADASGAQIMTQGQIGTHVLVNVRGQSRAAGVIESCTVPVFFTNAVRYGVVFRNQGNVHYVPAATVHVRNILPTAVLSADLNGADRFAFPGAKLTLSSEQPVPSRWGLYRVHMQVVDGDGSLHTRTRLMVGAFFPIAAVSAGIFFAGAGWWVYRIRRRRC